MIPSVTTNLIQEDGLNGTPSKKVEPKVKYAPSGMQQETVMSRDLSGTLSCYMEDDMGSLRTMLTV